MIQNTLVLRVPIDPNFINDVRVGDAVTIVKISRKAYVTPASNGEVVVGFIQDTINNSGEVTIAIKNEVAVIPSEYIPSGSFITIDAAGKCRRAEDGDNIHGATLYDLSKDNSYMIIGVDYASGGGQPGTMDYNALTNKPFINGFELVNNVSLDDINVYDKPYIDKLEADIIEATSIYSDEGDINAIKISKDYTDEEIMKLGNVMAYKGHLLTYAELLLITDQKPGDFWIIGDITDPNTDLEEYIWSGDLNKWEKFGTYSGNINIAINDSHVGEVRPWMGEWADANQWGWYIPKGDYYNREDFPDMYNFLINSGSTALVLLCDANGFVLPSWSARYLRQFGKADAQHDAFIPGNQQDDAMQRLTGEWGGFPSWYDISGGSVSVTSRNPQRRGTSLYDIGYNLPEKWSFDNALQARTDTENRPLSVTVVYYIKLKNIVRDRQYIIAAPESGVEYLPNQSMVMYQGAIYACIKQTVYRPGPMDPEYWEKITGIGGDRDTIITSDQVDFVSNVAAIQETSKSGYVVIKETPYDIRIKLNLSLYFVANTSVTDSGIGYITFPLTYNGENIITDKMTLFSFISDDPTVGGNCTVTEMELVGVNNTFRINISSYNSGWKSLLLTPTIEFYIQK